MSGPANNGGGAGSAGGGAVTPTPSGPIGGHLSRLVGSVSPPRAGGGKSTRPKAKTASRSAGKPAAKSKPRTTRSK